LTDDRYDPTERLTLLSPRAVNLESSAGGWDRLTWEDIAGALAKCSRPASLYGSIKIASHDGLMDDLFISAMTDMTNPAKVKWPRPPVFRKGIVRAMVNLVLRETLNPMICGTCNGIGKAVIDNLLIVCQKCGGSGHIALRNMDRAKTLGVEQLEWDRHWSKVHGHCLEVVAGWEREVYSALAGVNRG